MNALNTLGMASIVFVVWFTWWTYTAKDDGQARREALIEAWINLVIGFTINFTANLAIIPLMTDARLDAGANFWGGWIYTTISLLRQYAIRRWCSAHIARVVAWIASLVPPRTSGVVDISDCMFDSEEVARRLRAAVQHVRVPTFELLKRDDGMVDRIGWKAGS